MSIVTIHLHITPTYVSKQTERHLAKQKNH